MSTASSLSGYGKRVGAAFLALLVFVAALLVLFRGLVALSIVLHVLGIALVVYVAYESAPPG